MRERARGIGDRMHRGGCQKFSCKWAQKVSGNNLSSLLSQIFRDTRYSNVYDMGFLLLYLCLKEDNSCRQLFATICMPDTWDTSLNAI